MKTRSAMPLLFALAASTAARPLFANGAFPSAGQVLVDPSDPSTMWVRTSYAFAKTTDGGATFHTICEEAIGYSSGFHPHAALSQSGAIFMGLPDGLAIGRGDTCAFTRAVELEGSFVVDVSLDPANRAIALVVPPNGERARIFSSSDDLVTWSQLGAVLPDKLIPLTLDAAPSDPDVLYVSGVIDGPQPLGVLVTSVDAGATWTSAFVPGSNSEVAPYIAGVDPLAPERLFVRLNGFPGRLDISEDFGATFSTVLQMDNGLLQAFRLSEDGTSAIYGGVLDGLHRLDTSTFESESLAMIGARCVTIFDDVVYACGEKTTDGFTAGRSFDGGATFEALLEDRCVEGVLPCGDGAPVSDLCEPGWPAVRDLIGATGDCDEAGGSGEGGATSTTTGTGGADAGGAGASTASGDAGGASGGGGNDVESADGCACSLGSPSSEASAAPASFPQQIARISRTSPWVFWLGALAVALVRRREKNARHDPPATSRSHHRSSRRSRPLTRKTPRRSRRASRPL